MTMAANPTPEQIEARRRVARNYYYRHREACRVRAAAWLEANLDRHSETTRVWQEANRERLREYKRRWRAETGKHSEHENRRRAHKKGSMVEPVDRAAIIARDRSICHLCGKRVPKSQIHLDHIVPLSLGGPHVAANLAVAHASCNRRKGTKALNEQLRMVG